MLVEVVVLGVVGGVVAVLVFVVVLCLAVVLVPVFCASGCAHSARARLRRFSMPWRSVSRSPESIDPGRPLKSCSVLASAVSVAEQSPLPLSAACATVSKSPCSGPESATGISLPLELPQATEQRRRDTEHRRQLDAQHP